MSKKKIKDKITAYMETLGIYKEQYSESVSILANMLFDLETAEKEFTKNGRKFLIEYTNKNGSTNFIKNPNYQIIENLRRDSINVMKELGITPQGLKKYDEKLIANEPKSESILEKVMSLYESG